MILGIILGVVIGILVLVVIDTVIDNNNNYTGHAAGRVHRKSSWED